jgi:hypothetical protein
MPVDGPSKRRSVLLLVVPTSSFRYSISSVVVGAIVSVLLYGLPYPVCDQLFWADSFYTIIDEHLVQNGSNLHFSIVN